VQHFIPSDFGFDYDVIQPGHVFYDMLAEPKQELHAVIKQSGMAWTFIATGEFTDAMLSWPLLGTDLSTRTVTAPVSLETKIVSTPVRDIGRLTAAAIVDPQASNRQLYTGQHYTSEQVAAALEAATGNTFTRKTLTKAELEAALEKDASDLTPRFGLAALAQTGVMWPLEQTYKYGQFTYTPLETVARQVIKQ